MAEPTQELPSWLSYSTSLATNAAGEPTATFITVVDLPLTYYGPSIPLGSDGVWVYGGPSSPAPSSFDIPSTSPDSTITSPTFATPTPVPALPPITSSQLSTLTTLTRTTSSTPPSPFPSSVPSSVSPSSTSPPPINGEASGSNHAGVIVGSVLGSVVGSLLLLSGLICFMRRRQRSPPFLMRRPEPPMSQVMWMWHDVGEDDHGADLDAQLRSPGDASPQSSGDEREAFLRHSGEATNGVRDATSTARLVDAPRTSRDSSGPIGVALATGSKTSIPSPEKHHTREQLSEKSSVSRRNADKSPEEVDIGPDSPLLPPPPINISHGSRKSLLASERSMTPGNDPESARLYTAQRVNVAPSSPGTPWTSGIGIPNLLRRSWLNPKTRSTTPSPNSSLVGRQLTDSELEAGRSLNTQLRAEMGYRDGARPISGLSAFSTGSARSGNTVFYDAQSREDLSIPPPPVPPLPQGTASTGRNGPSPLSGEPLRASGEEPPAYEPNPPDNREPDDAVDYLDVPIPRPASPFTSVSSVKRLPPPPGLGAQVSTSVAAPSSDIAVNIKMLEEPPPAAGESWRQIAQALPNPHERRTTFGLMPSTIVYPRETTVSEQGSLHSMRSHVSPRSLSASGSAPVSNSNSAHSRGFTASSLKSLAHSSSISSADRRLARPSPGEVSPPISATGRRRFSAPPPPSQGMVKPFPVLPPAAPEPVQNATVTSTGTRSSVTTHASLTDPVTGEVVRVSHPPWTGGRDSLEWLDVRPPPPSSWGGSWSSPSHLRILQNRVAGREDASHA